LYVQQNGVNSNTVSYSIVPSTSTSISPNPVAVGAQLTINGSGFGASQGSYGFVSMQGVHPPIVSWSDAQIVVTIPSNAITGNMYVQQNGVSSNTKPFTIVPPPAISAISPSSAPAGSAVTITGSSFGSTQGSSTVRFNGTLASCTTWSSTAITAVVPVGSTSGNVIVHASGIDSNGFGFTVIPTPSIASLSPTSG